MDNTTLQGVLQRLKLQAEDNVFYELTNGRRFNGAEGTPPPEYRDKVLKGYNMYMNLIRKLGG